MVAGTETNSLSRVGREVVSEGRHILGWLSLRDCRMTLANELEFVTAPFVPGGNITAL